MQLRDAITNFGSQYLAHSLARRGELSVLPDQRNPYLLDIYADQFAYANIIAPVARFIEAARQPEYVSPAQINDLIHRADVMKAEDAAGNSRGFLSIADGYLDANSDAIRLGYGVPYGEQFETDEDLQELLEDVHRTRWDPLLGVSWCVFNAVDTLYLAAAPKALATLDYTITSHHAALFTDLLDWFMDLRQVGVTA